MIGEGFDRGVLANDPGRRGSLVRVFGAALDAVDAERAVKAALGRDGDLLMLNGHAVDLSKFDRCLVLAFGKASVAMARAVTSRLEDRPFEGVVITNAPEPIDGLQVLRATHPVPDEQNVAAARTLVEVGSGAGRTDLVVVAISGGGSALLTLPAENLSLEDVAATTALLLKSGASINELNTVRRHLSAVKGGRLAEVVCGAGDVLTLAISDVVGDDLSVIASGPMVPDPTTFDDAISVLADFKIANEVPSPVLVHLGRGAEGLIPDTPVEGFARQEIALIASAREAASGAARQAASLGWGVTIVTSTLTGEARDVALRIARDAGDLAPGELLVYAGETTVTVKGEGIGGRNQELALAASIEIAGDEGLVLLSAGTDGIDGMTNAAGAFADGHTVERGAALGLDAADFLRRNDSNSYLSTVGDALVTGPTGTNVGDLILVARSG
jgi:glycerate 2-kinase